jgi:hypothetical protein
MMALEMVPPRHNMMDTGLPRTAPSHTVIMTPSIRITNDPASPLVGTLFSTITERRHVKTGSDALRAQHTTPELFGVLLCCGITSCLTLQARMVSAYSQSSPSRQPLRSSLQHDVPRPLCQGALHSFLGFNVRMTCSSFTDLHRLTQSLIFPH